MIDAIYITWWYGAVRTKIHSFSFRFITLQSLHEPK
jgi:hypothetical protein